MEGDRLNQLTSFGAMENLFHQSYGKLCLFAKRLLADETQVEDIVQDVFLTLWEKKEVVNMSKEQAVLAYLYVAVKNACFKLHRRKKVIHTYKQKNIFEIAEEPKIFLEIVNAEAMNELYKAIQELPGGCMEILRKSVFEEMSNQEIADELNLSIHTIKSQKRRAVELLRNRLNPDTYFMLLLFVIY